MDATQQRRSKGILASKCPLDFGRHALSPRYNLGTLDEKLPAELQQMVLHHVDVKTLLAFRCVTMKAMEVVNQMLEFSKVAAHAPDTIRMAISLGTLSGFTIAELYTKLCQRTCDSCPRVCHFIDMVSLTRCCMSPFSQCDMPHQYEPQEIYSWLEDAEITSLPQIRVMAGTSNIFVCIDSRSGPNVTTRGPSKSAETYCDIQTAKYLEYHLAQFEEDRCEELLRISATVVMAPWLGEKSTSGEWGSFCSLCAEISKDRGEEARLEMPQQAIDWPKAENLHLILYTKDQLSQHMLEEHGAVPPQGTV
ncbi:hypothetical protein BDV96DRAFT_591778 [Lophiotrema nucula]|uniref:F-box domain-containing protein n=1 Tax=Lophiotrema nucula TaxID=690887 RepID=A0A6A5YGS0_9PLEO|nr:hypothetical protein BDV96DRAFT_591778 [Lophiotrema nucula]